MGEPAPVKRGQSDELREPAGAGGATARSEMMLLAATGVAKSFSGVPALIDGRIQLRRGSVHALCGGNGAGKSTFLGTLMGLHRPDAGTIIRNGRVVHYSSPAEALADGIAIITQELSPVLDMTVAENIFLGREPRRGGWFVDQACMVAESAALFARLHFDIDPKARMRSLSVAQIQTVEIAKAIGRQSEILIMDEPTSAIGEREAEILFDAIRSLQSHNVGIIFVSHRLTDIFSIADTYTVLRDGSFVETGAVAEIDRQRLIQLIVGRSLGDRPTRPDRAQSDVILAAEGYTRAGVFEDISIEIASGEIVGLYGLMGAGRSEFANALYGNAAKDAGTLHIDGRPVKIRSPADALRNRMALVTEDRKETGLVLPLSVAENITIAALARFARASFINGRREATAVDALIKRFDIRTPSRESPVRNLSGGNQQKVVFARCVETQPRILICDEPTRGIDEGTKREIYAFLHAFAAAGNAVLLISSEIVEILANADRVVVLRRGRIAGTVAGASATQETLVHLAS
jgi:putative xylitol transport system ATP-binding protein